MFTRALVTIGLATAPEPAPAHHDREWIDPQDVDERHRAWRYGVHADYDGVVADVEIIIEP